MNQFTNNKKIYDLEERTANEAESKKDFQHKIGICKKETKETKHWLRLLAKANPQFKDEFRILWQEAQELLLIFSKILSSSRN